jgi:hypothetical protein
MQLHQELMWMHQLRYTQGMRTTVNLPEPLLKRAKRFADERGMTINSLIEDGLLLRMAEPKRAARPFRLITVTGRPLDPSIDLNRTSELIMQEEEAQYKRKK